MIFDTKKFYNQVIALFEKSGLTSIEPVAGVFQECVSGVSGVELLNLKHKARHIIWRECVELSKDKTELMRKLRAVCHQLVTMK